MGRCCSRTACLEAVGESFVDGDDRRRRSLSLLGTGRLLEFCFIGGAGAVLAGELLSRWKSCQRRKGRELGLGEAVAGSLAPDRAMAVH